MTARLSNSDNTQSSFLIRIAGLGFIKRVTIILHQNTLRRII